MFSLREFIKKGFLDAVGKMADYQIILNATGWFDKNVLLEEDLAEINEAIEKQYYVEPIVENTPIEETEEVVSEETTTDESAENEVAE